MYGFRKSRDGGENCFSHPKFRRDSPNLLYHIKRKKHNTQESAELNFTHDRKLIKEYLHSVFFAFF